MTAIEKGNKADQLLANAHKAHLAIQGDAVALLERAMEAGDYLLAAKELVPHGEWLTALEEEGIPRRSASRYMAVAQERDRVLASGATSIREALQLIADRVPPRKSGVATGTRRETKAPSDRYTEGYEAGYRAGRADGAAGRRGRKDSGQPSDRDLAWLIKLAHPDLHHDDPHGVLVATRVTQWLNEMRGGRG